MQTRFRKKHAALTLVAILGVGLIVTLAYLLFPTVRSGLVGPLEEVGADGPLAALTADDDENVRRAAGDALVRHGPQAVPSLIRRLDRAGFEDRSYAVTTLGRMGSSARDAVPALTERMWHDPSEQVRRQAAQALHQVAATDAATVAEFVRLLAEGDDAGRVVAIEMLGAQGERADEVVPALIRALRDRLPQARQAAAEALEQLGAKAKHAIPALAEATRDPDRGVRKEACEALTRIVMELDDRDAELRDRGRAALDRAKAGEAVGKAQAP